MSKYSPHRQMELTDCSVVLDSAYRRSCFGFYLNSLDSCSQDSQAPACTAAWDYSVPSVGLYNCLCHHQFLLPQSSRPSRLLCITALLSGICISPPSLVSHHTNLLTALSIPSSRLFTKILVTIGPNSDI